MPLIKFYKKEQPWIWRCHIDLSNPNPVLWNYLKNFLLRYDIMIISTENYKKPDLPVEQRVIHPAIDPLSPKNKKLSDDDIHKYLEKYEIPSDKPIITQVARFDKHKDPEGAIRVFKKVKEKVDCRLVLCGSMASDDPEGAEIFENIESIVSDLTKNKDIILITIENDILVNVLQRASTVILQKSQKEGFGLTVAESLWKEKPVVASKVGGIPLQIEDGKSGYLLNPDDEDGFADRIIELIENPELCSTLGTNGKKQIKDKFLITRLLCDYLDLLNDIL
jgi:trehalose synthase